MQALQGAGQRLRILTAHLGGGGDEMSSRRDNHHCPRRLQVAPAAAASAGVGELPIAGWPDYLPMYEFVEVPRFEAGDPAALAHVNEHGYAVISVLSQSECGVALEMVWGHIEAAGHGVLRSDPATWVDEAWKASLPTTHAEPLWFVRGVPKVG